MRLDEILDTKIEYEVINKTHDEFQTASRVGGRSIIFSALDRGDGEGWDISFKEVDSNGRSSHGVTGKGKQFEVFAVVKDSLLDFVKRYDPEQFYFSAEKEEEGAGPNVRADLYDRLVSRIAIPNYKFTRSKESDYRDYFIFKKVA